MTSTKNIEKIYVKDVYEKIAQRFSITRSGYYWKSIAKFVKELPKYSLIADAGCGNGRYIQLNKHFNLNHQFIGFDFCKENTKICNERGFNIAVADTKRIPYRDNTFDATISIAVIHHLDTIEGRISACKEIKRITKVGGKIFIQVWASNVPKTKKFIKINDKNDYYITWQVNKDTILKRYYHLFDKDEFIDIVEKAGIIIEECFYDHDNWVIIGNT